MRFLSWNVGSVSVLMDSRKIKIEEKIMTTQLEALQSKNAREMAEYITNIIDNSECDACPAKGKFCSKRPKAECVDILEDFFNSKIKRSYKKALKAI